MKLTIAIQDLLSPNHSPIQPLCSRIREYLMDYPDLVKEMMAVRWNSEPVEQIPFYVIAHPVVTAITKLICEAQDRDFNGIDRDDGRLTYPALVNALQNNGVSVSEFMIGDEIDRNALLKYLMQYDKTHLELEI